MENMMIKFGWVGDKISKAQIQWGPLVGWLDGGIIKFNGFRVVVELAKSIF